MLVDSKPEQPSKPKNRKEEENLASEATQKILSQNAFKEASNAAISVYHNTLQHTENQPFTPSSYPNVANTLGNTNSSSLHSSDAYAQQNLQSEKNCFFKEQRFIE